MRCSSVARAFLPQGCPSVRKREQRVTIPYQFASRDEHEQARRFLPLRPEDCAVYVVRGRDLWTDRRARRVDVALTLTGSPIPRLPANPAILPSVFGNHVLEIHDRVYAMWEMAPGDYQLHALSVARYGGAYLAQTQGDTGPGMGVLLALMCT